MARDFGVGCGLLLLAVLYWLGADTIRVSPLEGNIGAQAMPKALAVSLGVLSLVLLGQSVLRHRLAGAQTAEGEEVGDRRRALGLWLIGAAYVLVLGTLGYLLAIGLLLLATAAFVDRRLTWRMVVLASVGAALYYLVFAQLLGIRVPAGIWPRLVA